MRVRIHTLGLLAVVAACAEAPSAVEPPSLAAARQSPFPEVMALPDGFWPEGIDFGRGTTFFVGSLATGAIFRGDAAAGSGSLLVPSDGLEKVGIRYDARSDRLFVAGGFTGMAFVYDAGTGALLAQYQMGEPGMAVINDVALTPAAAYFTDSFNDVLYLLPFGPAGALPPEDGFDILPLSGDWFSVESEIGNANGIVATAGGRYLLVVNTSTGIIYRVDSQTGSATAVDVGGAVLNGDGLLLAGHDLYVVQGHLNEITVVRMSGDFTAGTVIGALSHGELRFPSTIARFGNALYAVNARFDVVPEDTTSYQVVRVPMTLRRPDRGSRR